jgi:FKBP-type peptidyl-prolyl cis-trans isomerase
MVKVKSYVVRTQDDLIREFIAQNKYTVTEAQPDGLRYIRLKAGTGEIPTTGKIVKVKYTGRFLNTKAFDGNMSRSDSLSVTVGGKETVLGFQKGIEKMRLGEKAVLIFPSSLGYGVKGTSSIPGNTPLFFEVYIAKIQ